MNDAEFDKWIEAGWRRRLTPEEDAQLQAWLALHPERQADWEAESQLNQALHQLPDAPVPSNFTALVLQAAQREVQERQQRPARSWWQHVGAWLVPRPATGLAWAALIICVGWFARHQVQLQSSERHARDLAILTCAALLPEPQVLATDFETVRRLPMGEDDELLAVLNEATATP